MKSRYFFVSIVVLILALVLAQASSVRAFSPLDVIQLFRGAVLSESDSGRDNVREVEKQKRKEIVRFKTVVSDDDENEEDVSDSSRSGKLERKVASKSSELKERVCENRREFAKHRLEVVGERVNKLLDHMDGVLERVEKFYIEKLKPKGIVVSNYDALLSDIASKSASLKISVSTVEDGSENISCERGEVKTDLKEFKGTVTTLERAMKDYRDAIKAFVKAIRTAAGNFKQSNDATESGDTN